jgi:hypothetical protein
MNYDETDLKTPIDSREKTAEMSKENTIFSMV